jgi:hypothetical protein
VAGSARTPKPPLRQELLKVTLLPYQLDGITFAVSAARWSWPRQEDRRNHPGDRRGQLRARAGIRKVLVICPASPQIAMA